MSDRKRTTNQCRSDSCAVAPTPPTTHYPLSTPHHSPRSGFTLIEIVVAITVSTLLLGIAVVLLASLMRSEHSGREHFERGNSLDALAARFRKDVHAAESAPGIIGENHDTWFMASVINNSSIFVLYTVDGGHIARSEQILVPWDKSQQALNEPRPLPDWCLFTTQEIRQETYALPKDCTVSIETETIDGVQTVVLLIAANDASPDPGRNIRIEARLGGDRRFDPSEKAEEK